ncbi:hypothetical protein EDD86DRAFT_150211 [Gorgonomyces haynaldii]|nr:hypothetical protein EDD86DRAFT_150211 [Gorgonomyces haynaldii]
MDFTESMALIYRPIAGCLIVCSCLVIVFACLSNTNHKPWIVTSQVLSICVEAVLFGSYYDPVLHFITNSGPPLIIWFIFQCSVNILEIYAVLDPERITKQRILFLRISGTVLGITTAITNALVPYFDWMLYPNFALTFIWALFATGYDQMQGIFLSRLVYAAKKETHKIQQANTLKRITWFVLFITLFDYLAISISTYNSLFLPSHQSIYPFAINVMSLHSILQAIVFFELKRLTFNEKVWKDGLSKRSISKKQSNVHPISSIQSARPPENIPTDTVRL